MYRATIWLLRKLIQTALLESNNVQTIEELEDMGYFGMEEITPNNNFLITGKGVTYTFNAGEYSAFPLGKQEILLPYNLIRHLLREDSPISKISKL